MKKYSFLILGSVFLLNACTYQKNNTIAQDDVNDENTSVYGVSKDSAAAQLKNVYTSKPELADRTDAIREKLYGPPATEVLAPVAVVTVAKDTTAKK
jgi:hypothetical protein